MTVKYVKPDEVMSITPSMERSATRAFNEFGKRRTSAGHGVPPLATSRGPSCCDHQWKRWTPQDASTVYLRSLTEEDPNTADRVEWCSRCGAVAYRDGDDLWLYDATAKFYDRPPRQKRRDQNRR